MATLLARLLAGRGWYHVRDFEQSTGLTGRSVRNYVERLHAMCDDGGALWREGLRLEDEGRGKTRRIRLVQAGTSGFGPTSAGGTERVLGVHLATLLVRVLVGTELGTRLEAGVDEGRAVQRAGAL